MDVLYLKICLNLLVVSPIKAINDGGDLSKNSPKKKSSPNKKKQSLGYATRAKLVQNKGDKKAVARILQEEAKSKARTTLETAMHEAWLWFVNNNGIGSSLNALKYFIL